MNLPSMSLPFALGRFGMPSGLVAAGRPRAGLAPGGAAGSAPGGALSGVPDGAPTGAPTGAPGLSPDPLAPPLPVRPPVQPPAPQPAWTTGNDDGGRPRGVVDAPRVPATSDGADGPQTRDQRRLRAQQFDAYPGLAGRIRGISNLY